MLSIRRRLNTCVQRDPQAIPTKAWHTSQQPHQTVASNLQAPVLYLTFHIAIRTFSGETSKTLSFNLVNQPLLSITATMGRQFFVGGNFKMSAAQGPTNFIRRRALTLPLIRNGTIKSITDIVHHLNDAKLDPKTGRIPAFSPMPSVALPLAPQASAFLCDPSIDPCG